MRRIFTLAGIILAQFTASSQNIEGFTLTNVVNDLEFSLSDYSAKRAVVVIFFSGKCAYGNYYINRIKDLKSNFKDEGVGFIFINSNASDFVEEESLESMKKYAANHKIGFPYLADKDKKISSMLKATRTPEAFLLKPDNGTFRIVYQGAIDDSPQSASDVDHAFLKNAIVNLLNNPKAEMEQIRAVGCLIK